MPKSDYMGDRSFIHIRIIDVSRPARILVTGSRRDSAATIRDMELRILKAAGLPPTRKISWHGAVWLASPGQCAKSSSEIGYSNEFVSKIYCRPSDSPLAVM